MPKVTCLSGVSRPTVVENVTTVVVETDEGTPIAVVTESVPGGFMLIPATDPDFNRIMTGLGLNQVTVRQLNLSKQHQGQLLSGPLGGYR